MTATAQMTSDHAALLAATADEAALLTAILTHPHNDAPRLMLADALDEAAETVACPRFTDVERAAGYAKCGNPCPDCHGSGRVPDGRAARAEFIRVQIELERFRQFSPEHRKEFNEAARIALAQKASRLERGESESIKIARAIEEGGKLYDRRRDTLLERERELWGSWPDKNDMRSQFQAALPSGLEWVVLPHSYGGANAVVSRGFISHITTDTATFLRHAMAIFRTQPVMGVTLTDKRPWGNISNFEREDQAKWWTWLVYIDNNANLVESGVPLEIYRLLEKSDFKTEAAALADLSAACVSYGRREAGLI